jgi:hypothetical protein
MLFRPGSGLGVSRSVLTRATLRLFHPVLRDGTEMFLCVRSPTVREGWILTAGPPLRSGFRHVARRAQFLAEVCDSTGRALS